MKGPLDRSTPPFFRQGITPGFKFLIVSLFALTLMFSDVRWKVVSPLRTAISVLLYPVQWVAMLPVNAMRGMSGYFQDRQTAQFNEQQARSEMMALAARASQTKELMLENSQLRALLETRARLGFSTRSAEAIYEAKDSFSRKLILDAGQAAGVIGGAAVMDESGLVGQITRTYPLLSELTLITDPEQATSVLNTRTGARGLVFGESSAAGQLELRFMAANADVELGDILTTSGIDGVFPPGLPVAKISQIDRQSDSVFARIRCQPIARLDGVRHLLVILSEGSQLPAKPEPNDTQRKTARTSKQ